jgi:hypothetical protein
VVLPAPVPPAMPIMNGFVFASLLAAMAQALSSCVLCFVVVVHDLGGLRISTILYSTYLESTILTPT